MFPQVTDDEIDQAVSNYCDLAVLAPVPKSFEKSSDLYYRAIHGLRISERRDRGRRRLGKFLVRRYRKQEAVQGLIDWEKFHDWIEDHMAEINMLRLILSILMFMLLL